MDTSFKSLDQIVADITEQVKKLNSGSIDTPEIELLTSNAQELYERLVVIRHKAFEKMAYRKGFLMVSSSPLTRSSHHAGDDFAKLKLARDKKQAKA